MSQERGAGGSQVEAESQEGRKNIDAFSDMSICNGRLRL